MIYINKLNVSSKILLFTFFEKLPSGLVIEKWLKRKYLVTETRIKV